MTEPIRIEVGADQAGQRLDVFLGSHPAIGSRSAAERLIEGARVRVDGVPRQKRYRVEAGQTIEALPEEPAPQGDVEAAPHEIAFEDDHLLVVDKPAGVVVHPAPGHPTGTLVEALEGRAAGGNDPYRPGIVHRLDRDTSGLLVVAKNDHAHRALQEQLRNRELTREYLALVDGRPDARSGTIDVPIGRDRRNRTIHSSRTDTPREARTHFTIEQALPRTTLLRVRLETGRTHQIRVHLSAIGHPVCGDPEYGGESSGRDLCLRANSCIAL